MEILSFIKGLRYKFSKNEISKSCELIQTSLREHTLPAYTSAVELFGSMPFKSAAAKSMAANFKRMAGGNGNMVSSINLALNNAQGLLTSIDQKAETMFGDQEATMALSYQKATYLQIVSAIGFANDYARKLLNFLYIVETEQADSEQTLVNNLTRAELAYVEKYFQPFCTCMKVMMLDFKTLDKSVTEMPDVVITTLSEQTLPHTIGMHKIDPLGMRNLILPVSVGVKWNPFYLIGTMIASFQVACYKASIEERDLLQMRKLNLEKIQERSPDPHLQQQIEYMADRVSKLNYEILEDQEKYNVR